MTTYNYNGDLSFLQKIAEAESYGTREGVKIFEDIYPTWSGVASIIGATDIFTFFDNSIEFDINDHLVAGTTPKIHFQTGNLAGYEFNLKRFDAGNGKFVISPAMNSDNFEIPNSNNAFKIAEGDTFVILDITLPQSYIDFAERKLFQAVKEQLDKNCLPTILLEAELDRIYLKNNPVSRDIIFEVGDTLKIVDQDLIGGEMELRILAIKRDVFNPEKISLTFANNSFSSAITNISKRSRQSAAIINNTVFSDPAGRRIANQKLKSNILDGGQLYG